MSSGFWKRNVIGILALIVAITAVAGLIHSRTQEKKIGYAETSVVLSEFTEAIKARKQFEESQKEWERNLKTLNDSMGAAMDRMKKGYDAAGKEERQRMQATLQQRNEDLQRYSNAVKKMSNDREKELMDPVIKKVNGFLELWGRQHGYDLIFGTMTGGNILQADPKLNLTVSILKDLNEQYKDLPVKGADPLSGTDSASAGKKTVVK